MTTIARTLPAALLAAMLLPAAHAQQRGNDDTRDVYGYSLLDSTLPDRCAYDYVVAAPGSELVLGAGRPGAVADDHAAVVALDRPFELYEVPRSSLVVSANGYLAAAASFTTEDGSDYSNDCSLPAIADNPAASQDRIYAYHDDLRAQAGGAVRKSFFPSCPRPSDVGGDEACTVFEWDGFERSAGGTVSASPLRAQAVLYHDSHAVVIQYASLDDSGGASATVGLQGYGARSAKVAQCNRPAVRVQAGRAICFFDPRHPSR